MKSFIIVSVGILCAYGSSAQGINLYYDGNTDFAPPKVVGIGNSFYMFHNSDSKLSKLDHDGNLIWSRSIQLSSGSVSNWFLAASDHLLILTGSYTVNSPTFHRNNVLIALDTNGILLWSHAADFNYYSCYPQLLEKMDSKFLSIGSRSEYLTINKWDSIQGLLFSKSYGDDEDGFNAVGSLIYSNNILFVYGGKSNPYTMPFIATFNINGELLWSKEFSTNNGNYFSFSPVDMIHTSDGNLLIAMLGHIDGWDDIHLLKITPTCELIWAKRLEHAEWWEGTGAIMEDSQQRLVLVVSDHYSPIEAVSYISRFDPDGNIIDEFALPYMVARFGRPTILERNDLKYAIFGNWFGLSKQGLSVFDFESTFVCLAPTTEIGLTISDMTWNVDAFEMPPWSAPVTDFPVDPVIQEASSTQHDICDIDLNVHDLNGNSGISVFPTPTTGVVQVELGSNASNVDVSVMDIMGRSILDQRVSSSNRFTLDLTQFSAGPYLVRIMNKGLPETFRVVKY